MEINELTKIIIGCGVEVHKVLGPGLLESTYTKCMEYELSQAGLFVERELGLALTYKNIEMTIGFRMDFLVEKKVVVEIKSIETITEVHTAQVLTYLKLSGAMIGLIMNFKTLKLVDGIKRLTAKTH